MKLRGPNDHPAHHFEPMLEIITQCATTTIANARSRAAWRPLERNAWTMPHTEKRKTGTNTKSPRLGLTRLPTSAADGSG